MLIKRFYNWKLKTFSGDNLESVMNESYSQSIKIDYFSPKILILILFKIRRGKSKRRFII